ncbi:hypothetical protein B1748_28475 [Paenibacillus sp. MY03]|uniref:hypothetical protein n=1 Tax=Paenibacillus sp. MY03 TaxID=302980 RepID=UPI000B3C8538|nr:hypothetical protein [Paenibacillus sp. MY03]OUS70431.1 hypothetical protein B1748_28475 [Paenibacillus sp. MY03]
MNISIAHLTRIINDWDPVGLLAGGAPEDEYSSEIRVIKQQAANCTSEIELAKLIQHVFYDWMSVKLSPLSCLKQAFIIAETSALDVR